MEFKGFRYKIMSTVVLTREEVRGLAAAAHHHYDPRCKAAAEPGGFLWPMCVGMAVDGTMQSDDFLEAMVMDFDQGQLQTMAKILEWPQDKGMLPLRIFLAQAIRANNDEYIRLHPRAEGD